jgi:CubicO group peptidase (beta-lactamase class C family)
VNDPVSTFIPELKGLKVGVAQERLSGSAQPQSPPSFYTIPPTREITIQDLLTHVSGLGSGPISGPEIRRIMPKNTETLADFMTRLSKTPLDFQPGSRWTYSPLAGFDTLARVVEVVSGQAFDRFTRERIFQPLGMRESFFHPGDERWPRVVTAYHREDGTLKKTENPNWLASKTYFSGAGGLLSTAEDYAQFAMMLAEGGQLNGKRLLSPKTVELMSSVFVPDTLPGRQPGRSYGLSVQVISDPIAAGQRIK